MWNSRTIGSWDCGVAEHRTVDAYVGCSDHLRWNATFDEWRAGVVDPDKERKREDSPPAACNVPGFSRNTGACRGSWPCARDIGTSGYYAYRYGSDWFAGERHINLVAEFRSGWVPGKYGELIMQLTKEKLRAT